MDINKGLSRCIAEYILMKHGDKSMLFRENLLYIADVILNYSVYNIFVILYH